MEVPDTKAGEKPIPKKKSGFNTFIEAAYFSVATETTVGYGDLSPQGLSRLFACMQAFLGLALGGAMVTKITSGPGGPLRKLVERCGGEWIEISHPRAGWLISLIRVTYANGYLRYDGDNFSSSGEYTGSFRGTLELKKSGPKPILSFEYINAEIDVPYFDAGTTTLFFSQKDPLSRNFNFFRGVALDKTFGPVWLIGRRASLTDAEIIASTDRIRQGKLATETLTNYLKEPTRELN